MKHLKNWNKVNESHSNPTLEDVVNLLQDVIDEEYDVEIDSINGFGYLPSDIHSDFAEHFKTEMDGRRRIKFRVTVYHRFDFYFLLKFMNQMKSVVKDFETWGWELYSFNDVANKSDYMSYEFIFV